jgi:hypothetical protein
MLSKAFLLGCWNNWHHAHRDGELARHRIECRKDGTEESSAQALIKGAISSNLLSIYSAKPSMYRISAASSSIIKELQCAISVFHINFFFFDGKIGRCYRARRLSAVFAMADVTTWFCEEVVVDCYCDATAQTAACYGFLEG